MFLMYSVLSSQWLYQNVMPSRIEEHLHLYLGNGNLMQSYNLPVTQPGGLCLGQENRLHQLVEGCVTIGYRHGFLYHYE